MTSRLVENALAEWLGANAPEALDDVTAWVVSDDTTEAGKRYPLGIVEVTGTQQHETLIGVYDLSTTVAIETNPEDCSTEGAATLKDALYALLGDRDILVSGLDNRSDLICWDARITGTATTPANGRRRDGFDLLIVAAAQVT